MSRLVMILFSLAATTLAGTGVIVALTAGQDNLRGILTGAGVGLLLAIPVAWMVARRLS